MKIVPITTGIPVQEGTELYIRVMAFDLDATTASLYWEVRTAEGVVLTNGNYTLTEEQFEDRTGNIENIQDILLAELGLERYVEP